MVFYFFSLVLEGDEAHESRAGGVDGASEAEGRREDFLHAQLDEVAQGRGDLREGPRRGPAPEESGDRPTGRRALDVGRDSTLSVPVDLRERFEGIDRELEREDDVRRGDAAAPGIIFPLRRS